MSRRICEKGSTTIFAGVSIFLFAGAYLCFFICQGVTMICQGVTMFFIHAHRDLETIETTCKNNLKGGADELVCASRMLFEIVAFILEFGNNRNNL